MGHLLGYAGVSTAEQDPALQDNALLKAGCARVWTDVASGSRDDRPELAKLLEQLLPGDTLVVWRLDRLGRSIRHLIDTVNSLDQRGVGFRPSKSPSTPPRRAAGWSSTSSPPSPGSRRHDSAVAKAVGRAR